MSKEFVKNQHYIPQTLLKHFANSKDQVYEGLVEVGKVYQTNFSQSMSERYTYEHPELEKNKVEKYFHKIESYIGSVVQGIIDIIEGYETGTNDFLEIKRVVIKYMREFIIFYYRSGALLTEFEAHRRNKEDRVFMMLENIMNSLYVKELSQTIIKYYNFAVIKSEGHEFLLSDQYVSTVALTIKNRFMNSSNRNMGLKDIAILIPLSGKYYAVFYDGKIPDYILSNKVNGLTQPQIDEINEVIINNSYKKCISKNREAIDRIIHKFEYGYPAAIYAGGNGINMGATIKKEVFFYHSDKLVWEMFTDNEWVKFRELSRNDKCTCGSGKKFKKCCIDSIEICIRMYDDIVHERYNYKVHEDAIGERPLSQFNNSKNRA